MEFQQGNTALSRDQRPIMAATGERGIFCVGEFGVTKITPYDENGEMSHVPWLAIWKGDVVTLRCAARDMTISYQNAIDSF